MSKYDTQELVFKKPWHERYLVGKRAIYSGRCPWVAMGDHDIEKHRQDYADGLIELVQAMSVGRSHCLLLAIPRDVRADVKDQARRAKWLKHETCEA